MSVIKSNIELMNEGDSRAYENTFKEYFTPLSLFVYKIIEDKDAAQDIVQEVFVKLWEKKLTFSDSPSLRGYLYNSVKNNALTYLRLKAGRERIRNTIDWETVTEDHYLRMQIECEVVRDLYKAINRLPRKCKEIFLKSYLEDLDIKQIALELNIAETTVKAQRKRAKQLLREHLKNVHWMWHIFFFFFMR